MEPVHSSKKAYPFRTAITASLAAITVDKENTEPYNNFKAPLSTSAKRYALGKGDEFPTDRRPQQRDLSEAEFSVIKAWFEASGIHIGAVAATEEQQYRAMRLLYTWRDCFALTVKDIKPTDLIEHSIDLVLDAKPVKGTLPKYTAQEREFANRIFPELEDAGIIVRRSSPWGARSKFPPKKKGSPILRVVHNFIPINRYTIKSAYPMHRLEEVLDTLIKDRFRAYFTSDASNGYWAIPMKAEDCNKTGFLTPNGQWVYKRMGQGLKGSPHTYAQFTDLVFGPLPRTESQKRLPTLIGNHGATAFSVFMDDHAAAADDYETLFEFLHTRYFPRVVFGPVYLSGEKTHVFADSLEMVGFQGNAEGLRPSIKHREKIINWPTPTNREELDAFLWLTPFLRIFIPGRAEHVLRLKEAYLELVAAEVKPKKAHDDETEECDKDPTKTEFTRAKKPTVRTRWVEKSTFDWTAKQQESFEAIKKAISENAMAGADPELQYHLVADASQRCIGGAIFQLKGVPAGTEASPKFQSNERIIMFLSFRLNDAETRYVNSERECLAIVRCLAEVRWLVIGSKYPVKIYTDHNALQPIFAKGQTEKGRISNWMDRLGEYDIEVHYRPSRDQHIGIADGLSRMPTRLTTIPKAEDADRIAMAAPEIQSLPRRMMVPVPDRLVRYKESPLYEHLIEYLQQGPMALEKLPRNRKRHIINKAKRYTLPEAQDMPNVLKYTEITGATSICLVEEEIPRMLSAAHEDHGHFGTELTLDFLVGRAYWPTRVKDVRDWCQGCYACQLRAKKPIQAEVQAIQKFEPLSMIGMDWLGPISPPCELTKAQYVLVMVDYFSRFVWAKAYVLHRGVEVCDMFENHLSPIFGYPKSVYSDNGSHFVNDELRRVFIDHGVTHFTGPITHPSSTGLLERAVQGIQSYLRTKALERMKIGAWSLDVRDAAFFQNTKTIRLHGYLPAELMLGFEPKLLHFDTDLVRLPQEPEDWAQELPAHQHQIYMALRDENKCLASEAASYRHYGSERRKRKARLPEPGDLVLVRHHAIDNQRGRKLEAKWLGPRLLTRLSASRLSGYVRELHGDGKEKKYHINDLLLYYERQNRATVAGATLEHNTRGTTPAITGGGGIRITPGGPGGRAVMLLSQADGCGL